MNNLHSIILVVIAASVTILLRALPFILLQGKETPPTITYLGQVLPYSIMAMLVVYCLRNIQILKYPFGLAELIAIIVTTLLHIYKRNTLISIVCGTICYMVLIQFVFV